MTEELVHIRCHTCNKVIGHMLEKYNQMLNEGKTIKEALYKLGLTRICCRTRMMNPFKVIQSERQTPPELIPSFEKLSISSSDEAPTKGALSAMQSVTRMTIMPEEQRDIRLPALPSFLDLPVDSSIKTRSYVCKRSGWEREESHPVRDRERRE